MQSRDDISDGKNVITRRWVITDMGASRITKKNEKKIKMTTA